MTRLVRRRRPRERRLIIVLAAALLVFLVLGNGTHLIVDGLWFEELGYLDVFRTRLVSQVVVGIIGFLLAFAILASTLVAAVRRSPGLRMGVRGEIDLSLLQLEKRLPLLALSGAAIISIALATSLAREWLTLQIFFKSVTYGLRDPIFSNDIGFYLFRLPALRLVQGWLFLLLILALFGTAGIYALRGGLVDRNGMPAYVRRHLGLLGVFFLLLLGSHFALAQYDILRSPQGAVYGAGYSDVHYGLLGLRVLVVVTLVAAVLLGIGAARGKHRWMIVGPAAFFVFYLLGVVILPSALQKLVVEPNEFSKEKAYIEHALRLTREAFDLEEIENLDFEPARAVDTGIMQSRRSEIENIRLWDYRLLLPTYRQLQEIRPYYNFGDVDVDRYTLNGRYRQVMLSARELAYDQINEEARTWVNLHLVYTHGYGLCMSPVNEITPEGLPELMIRNIPPISNVDLEITRPEIYYGEQTTEFSLVLTSTDEFDYPEGETNRFTRYQGKGGMAVGSWAQRLLFAWHLRSQQLLLTNYLTSESRILLHRSIKERVPKIAPFLRYDRDPYLVIHGGRLAWILDAYTVSSRFPYSRPVSGVNYIRNAVKIVMDAYDGTTHFYSADSSDPLLQTYQRIFPSLFKPLEEMPAGLRQHLRYPVDLFRLQAETYATFHMEDPQVFYNKEDLWQLPIESFGGREIIMEPYYTIMRLPESEREELVLMLPFTPSRKDNMIAWMAVRCDGDDLGRRLVFLFPKQELVYGPRQIEARIDQDAEISQQLTLWSQRGSDVIRGNLLVIPIGRSLLYVEPLYLQAEKGALPELKRVILAHENSIAMNTNLESTLGTLFAQMGQRAELSVSTPSRVSPPPAAGTLPGRASDVRRALEIFESAEAALRRGDWAEYGEQMKRLRQELEGLAAPGQP